MDKEREGTRKRPLSLVCTSSFRYFDLPSGTALAGLPLRCLAVREEGVSNNLCSLSTCDVNTRPEVRSVLAIAWLSRSTARIATHYSECCQALDVDIECLCRWYICVGLGTCWDRVVQACCIGYDLRDLATGSWLEWAEVWSVERCYAWLTRYQSARVTTHKSTVGKSVDVRVESVGRRYIFKDLRTWILAKACGYSYHLGNLTTGHIVEWSEVSIIVSVTRLTGTTAWITVSNLAACQAPYVRIELRAR